MKTDYESVPAGEGKDVGICPRCNTMKYIRKADKVAWDCRMCGMIVENDKPYILGENVCLDYRDRFTN